MANTRTKTLLNLLDETERRALTKALKSPIFTAKTFLRPLYKQLSRAGRSDEETPERIFAAVFPNKAYGDGHAWNKALSELNTAIREFLAIRQTLHDPHLSLQAELAALAGREDGEFFQQRVEAALATLEAAPESTDGWQLRFKVQQLATARRLADSMQQPDKPLDALDETLDCYHAICRLQLACNRASLVQLQKTQTDVTAFRRLLDETEALDYSGRSALLSLYRATLRLLADLGADVSSFARVLCLHGPRVARAELESVLILGFNYCIWRYREGDVEALRWYRVGYYWARKHRVWATQAAQEAFLLNKGILFAKTRDRKSFEDLLENGAKTFPKRRREKAEALTRAYWHFYQGEFEAAAGLLARKVDSRHARYTLLFHSLKVRNAFEEWRLGEKSGELGRALGSFEDFLQRSNPFADSFCQSYHNLIWFIRQLSKRKPPKKEYLEKELQSRQPAVPDWVAAKISELPH